MRTPPGPIPQVLPNISKVVNGAPFLRFYNLQNGMQFIGDQEDKEHVAEDAYSSRVVAIQERAKTLYTTVEENEDGTFSLLYENSPLWHVYERFRTYSYMSFDDVEERLNAAQIAKDAAQTGACEVSQAMQDRWMKRADALHMLYSKEAPGYYSLTVPDGYHMFDGFWYSNELLSAGQIEYRLRYIEGVISREN